MTTEAATAYILSLPGETWSRWLRAYRLEVSERMACAFTLRRYAESMQAGVVRDEVEQMVRELVS